VRPTNPENCLTRFLNNSENRGGSRMGIFKKKNEKRMEAILRTCPQKLEPMVLTKK
jgi:hypothetical protein